MPTLYDISGFSYTYHNRTTPAISDITLTVDEGELLLICGKSGCGKSTLLSCMKNIQPLGSRNGKILFLGKDICGYENTAADIGYAAQFPEEQTVTDKVWHELAFGAESMGMKQEEIRSRIAEVSIFFGIEKLLYRKTDELSGGQKQIISIASLLVMRPRVLILDEPLSQLDPTAAEELTDLLGRINNELGTAIVIAEHRLPRLMSLADKMIVMDSGKILFSGTPKEIPRQLNDFDHPMLKALPCHTQAAAAANTGEYPISVKDGKEWYKRYSLTHTLTLPEKKTKEARPQKLCTLRDIYFSYPGTEVIKGLSLDIFKGELLTITGGNAAGKSTLLQLICGNLRPISGRISFERQPKFGFLPQETALLFSEETVLEELTSTGSEQSRIDGAVKLCRLEGLLDRHPLDLSGGERQRAALAKLLALSCDFLLLDEPTKGLDAEYKLLLSDILHSFCNNGGTVILVSHDNDFCAENADRCAVLFGGEITCCLPPEEFFTKNIFYTTDAAKVAEGVADIYTAGQLIRSVAGNKYSPPIIPDGFFSKTEYPTKPTVPKKKRSLFRRICTAAGLIGAAAVMVLNSGIFPVQFPPYMPYIMLILPVVLLMIGILPGNDDISRHTPPRRYGKGEITALIITACVIIITALVAMPMTDGRGYLIVALLILTECFIPFILFLEKKKPAAKDIAAMAVMCAAAVAGRELFFMLPQFKPTAAIVIIAAAAFGAQPGFIIGAAAMLVSNLLFSQGPWTVWQMLGMGLVGFFAGLIFSRKRSKAAMCIYGTFATTVLYGGIMNISSFLTSQSEMTVQTFSASLMAGLPFDLIHGAATAIFVLLLSGELVKRLDRITDKYGLFK